MIGRAFVAGKAIIENATLLHPRFISIRLGTLIKLKKTSKLFYLILKMHLCLVIFPKSEWNTNIK